MRKRLVFMVVLTLVAALAVGCTSYRYKPVPFKAAESYPNHVAIFGAVVASQAWTNQAAAQAAFGFDIRGAGLTPVQIVVDNRGDHTLELLPDQILVLDSEQNYWNLLPAQVAYDRIDRYSKPERVVSSGATKAMLGGLGGGIIGAAIGIVTGQNVGEAAGKGAAAGAALGAVLGGMEGLDDPQARMAISEDLRSKSLDEKPLAPREISHGFLFFPGEIQNAQSLRLKLRDRETNEIQILDLNLAATQ